MEARYAQYPEGVALDTRARTITAVLGSVPKIADDAPAELQSDAAAAVGLSYENDDGVALLDRAIERPDGPLVGCFIFEFARGSRRRRVVKDEMNPRTISVVYHVMRHEIVQLESKMGSRRHKLRTDDKLDTRIGHQRNMNSVSNGKGGMVVFVTRDASTRLQPGDHSPQKNASGGVMLRNHLVYNGLGLGGQQIPAAGPADLDVRPAIAKQQDDRLRLRMHIILGLAMGVRGPRRLLQRQNLTGERRAIYRSQG